MENIISSRTVIALTLLTILSASLVSYLTVNYIVDQKIDQRLAASENQETTAGVDNTSIQRIPTASPNEAPQIDWDQRVQEFHQAIETDPELAAEHQVLYDRRTELYEQFENFDEVESIPQILLDEYEDISNRMFDLLLKNS